MWCLLSVSESPDSFAFHSYSDVYCQHQSRRKEWFVLLNLFFHAGQLQFHFIFSFDRSQHESSLEPHQLRQVMRCWPYLQSEDVTQIFKKHKASGIDLCMAGIRTDLCTEGGTGHFRRRSHRTALVIYTQQKMRKAAFLPPHCFSLRKSMWWHCFLIKNILSVRCDKYEHLRREVKGIFSE